MSTSIEEILSTLKTCESQKKMYNLMLQMYSNNLKKSEDLKYFKENDGPSLIISFLSKPNVKLLNISLGILAECCLNEDLCEDVRSAFFVLLYFLK